MPETPTPGPVDRAALSGGAVRLRVARSELRRQLREQKRVRTTALAVVVVMLLGAPILYFGILFATRDPVLNSLDRLDVPAWAAQSPEDRIISGSRWCFVDCRLRERTLQSSGDPAETTQAYQDALRAAGWVRWDVGGCPLAPVDGDYSCWTRDEYTLDLWVRPPDCAYDPLNLRPDLPGEDDDAQDDGDTEAPDSTAEPDQEDGAGDPPADEECGGAVVEIKMQNRVADQRGLPGAGDGSGEIPDGPAGDTPVSGSPGPTGATDTPDPADAG